MTETDQPDRPQLYLVTPPVFEIAAFSPVLAACLDAVPTACVRLSLASRDMDAISRTADAMREVCHARDVAIVIEAHMKLVEPLGLDGVHMTDGSRGIRTVRKTLGEDAIVGTWCATSRHDGMTAGKLGADYVSFGPLSATPLDSDDPATLELFQWWSEMIEVPVVAEGSLDAELIATLAPHADFIALGAEIWSAPDPAQALRGLYAAFG